MTKTTSLTKQEKIDAAVEIVEEHAREALALGVPPRDGIHVSEYIEAYQVSVRLQERGFLSHEHTDSPTASWRDAAVKSMEGQARRLLDAAAEQGRIVRWSARKDGPAPRLDGYRRAPYLNGTGFTTQEVINRANAAFEERVAQEQAGNQMIEALLQWSIDLGLPRPLKANRAAVTFSVESFQEIVGRVEQLEQVAKSR